MYFFAYFVVFVPHICEVQADICEWLFTKSEYALTERREEKINKMFRTVALKKIKKKKICTFLDHLQLSFTHKH